ncbi:acyl-CoA thioesterase [Qipengyuania huizhouensis]|jgi:acyl-CoA thioester hydrolase|uniref:acyl-CoA thioesterase n=1 Tax=Qipengyuania huizhouensis TaxID=2867245 RepID=UPI001C877276|nr:thioesterase family protein [Qipengyuania huizhouensis]MBX7460030.1 acyl-CoA thioesterase [Qipengyuania huizhouensis]
MKPFRHTFRVRYAEVDPQSVVFNSRYLEYADVLVSEFFRDARERGLPVDAEFHVRRAEVDYLAPIRLEELIEGRLTVEAIGNSSMRTLVTLHGAEDGSLRAEIRLLTVHVDLPEGRPSPVPDGMRQACGFPARETVNG